MMDLDPEELRNERLKTPYDTDPKSKESRDPAEAGVDTPKDSAAPGKRSRVFPALTVLSLILVFGLSAFLYTVWANQQVISSQLVRVDQQLNGLSDSVNLIADRLEEDQNRMDSMNADIDVLGKRLGVTANELQRARTLAERLREEQQKNVENLTDQIRAKADSQNVETLSKETSVKFEEVDEQISGVKEEVVASRQEIEKTWTELASLGLKMTEQGNLIATNSGGIQELKRRGERDYYEFDAKKKTRIRVGGITVELRKADQKRQRADLKLFYDDREVEKKQIYTNNPVSFYVGQERTLYEFVINEVRKDQVLGYISVPKGTVPAGAPALG